MRKLLIYCAILGATGVGIATLIGTPSGADRLEHLVGGKPADQVFQDRRVASLVNAACEGDVAAMKRSIADGADPNFFGSGSVTPLFWALACRNSAGVEQLLRAGADPNFMLPGEHGFSPVWGAAAIENSKFLKLLLQYGGDPNAADSEDVSTALERALYLALEGKGWDNYYALLDAGVDINREHSGKTIADQAAALRAYDKVAELLNRGYDHNLIGLAAVVRIKLPYLSDSQNTWRMKVIGMLEKRGVQVDH